jgi:hypothetical protein
MSSFLDCDNFLAKAEHNKKVCTSINKLSGPRYKAEYLNMQSGCRLHHCSCEITLTKIIDWKENASDAEKNR